MTLLRGLVFPEIVLFLKKKNQRQHRRNRAQKEVPFSTSTRKFIFLMLIGGSGSKSQYDSFDFRSELMARKLCHEKIWVKTLRSGFCRRVPKMVQKMIETYFSQKCPKSISLDSGHLDKPFGPLIFKFYQYVQTNQSIKFESQSKTGISLIFFQYYFFDFLFDRFFGLFFRFGDPLDPLTCISLREGVMQMGDQATAGTFST